MGACWLLRWSRNGFKAIILLSASSLSKIPSDLSSWLTPIVALPLLFGVDYEAWVFLSLLRHLAYNHSTGLVPAVASCIATSSTAPFLLRALGQLGQHEPPLEQHCTKQGDGTWTRPRLYQLVTKASRFTTSEIVVFEICLHSELGHNHRHSHL